MPDDFLTAPHQPYNREIADLQSALQAEQAETNHLVARVRQLEADLAVVRTRRGFSGLLTQGRESFDRYTGGGLRKLANRTWIKALAGVSNLAWRLRRTAAIQRALQRIPRLNATLRRFYRMAQRVLQTRTSNAAAESHSVSDDPLAGSLTAPAKSIYQRLQIAVSESHERSRSE
jgi:hypothetical protein